MKVQIIHAKEFWFKSNEPATKIRELPVSLEEPIRNALVIFVSIEENDKALLDEIKKAFTSDVIKLIDSLKPGTIVLYPYAHLSDKLAPPSIAISIMKELESSMKSFPGDINVKIIRAPFGWYKEFYIYCYGHPVSELSRRYERSDMRNIPERECYPLRKIIESLNLKPVFKEVYKRWGYFDKTGIFPVQLNALVARIQSLFNASLRIYSTHLCNINEILQEKMEPPGLITNANGNLLLFFSKSDLDIVSTGLFEKPVFISGNKLYVESEEIGVCTNSLCITYPVEIVLAKRVYIAIKESEFSENPPSLECWLSPVNIYIATATGGIEEVDYAGKIAAFLDTYSNLRIYLDERRVRLGRKLRDAGQLWSNYTIIIGKSDIGRETLAIRDRREGIQFSIGLSELETVLNKLIKPCRPGIGYIKKITS
ncbi:MAG: hypothetical protein F7B60_05375 [Desulfurococcales archaeon]|nr:hypothetical protein [Desulfurococcales archaeon]